MKISKKAFLPRTIFIVTLLSLTLTAAPIYAGWGDFTKKIKKAKNTVSESVKSVENNQAVAAAKKVQENELVQSAVASQRTLSPEEEYYLGRAVAANVFAAHPLANDNAINSYLNRMGQFLALHSSRSQTFHGYRFALINSNAAIATSAPGGFVFISRGMLKKIRFEDELAAVLAHEIAHIALRHAEAAIRESHLNNLWGKAGGKLAGNITGKKYEAIVADAAANALNKSHSRRHEMAADKEAVTILAKAGYNPFALSYFLRKQKTKVGWNSTHPSDKVRIDALKQSLASHKNKKLPRTRTKRLQRRLASIQ